MKSVLVVDDEPHILKMVAAVLEDLGCEDTQTAGDAETALVLMQKQPPDMVITDVKLPGMDGVELARRIKRGASKQRLPVVLMSAYGEPTPNPGDGFLHKPFDIDQLARVVKHHLRNGH
jgi:two-component system response regulator (stage 0 sporulation protein F)